MKTPTAVVFDIYGTLLDIGKSAENAGTLWKELHNEFFGCDPTVTLEQLSERCTRNVSADHAAAHARGIGHPEVVWADVMKRALPGLAFVGKERLEDFLFRHVQLLRSLRLSPGGADSLRECLGRGLLLGIASNAQPYTLRELKEKLKGGGLSPEIFARDLCMWSFENGFSKPNPHVFRMLAFRLERRGIRPEETLVIGDRLDNDIEPARAQGFQTWWLNKSPEGNWQALAAARFSPG